MTFNPARFGVVKYHMELVPNLLKKYSELFNWAKPNYNGANMSIVDIGTGPGQILMKAEKNFPKNYKELMCLDISKEMVDYLNNLPEKDSRIFAKEFDLQSPQVPEEWKNRFDFAFSSYCLSFMKDYRQAFSNSGQLLKRNGELFFIWCKKSVIFDVYSELNKIQKWAPYTDEYKNWINYSSQKGFLNELEKYITDAGMKVLKMEELNDVVFEDVEAKCFIDTVSSLDMLSHRIPKSDLPKYREDFVKIYSQLFLIVDENAENGMKAKKPFPSIVVAARKM